MNIFGIGPWELVAVLIIMLIFAGPKRMIHWSHILGQHVSKFRRIWSETVDLVQKEFDDAGVDIKLPKEPPTRQNLNRTLTDAVKPMTQPMQDSLNEVKQDFNTFNELSAELNDKKAKDSPKAEVAKSLPASKKIELPVPAKPASKTPEPDPPLKLGTWSGETLSSADGKSNGSAADLGTWSKTTGDD